MTYNVTVVADCFIEFAYITVIISALIITISFTIHNEMYPYSSHIASLNYIKFRKYLTMFTKINPTCNVCLTSIKYYWYIYICLHIAMQCVTMLMHTGMVHSVCLP